MRARFEPRIQEKYRSTAEASTSVRLEQTSFLLLCKAWFSTASQAQKSEYTQNCAPLQSILPANRRRQVWGSQQGWHRSALSWQ